MNDPKKVMPSCRSQWLCGAFWIALLVIAIVYTIAITYSCGARPSLTLNLDGKLDPNSLTPAEYLEKVTSFYEQVITVLSIISGILLALCFVYVHAVSKHQASEIIYDALNSGYFSGYLERKINEKHEQALRHINKRISTQVQKTVYSDDFVEVYMRSEDKYFKKIDDRIYKIESQLDDIDKRLTKELERNQNPENEQTNNITIPEEENDGDQ